MRLWTWLRRMKVFSTARRRRFIGSLATILLVGELSVIGVQGTFASYTSQLTNGTSKAASGTLTLETRYPSATGPMCLSYGGPDGAPASNNNTMCTPTVALSGGPFKPGTSTSFTVRVVNSGSLSAGDLSVAPSKTFTCPTSFCGKLELTIQEVTSAGTNVKCFYPTTGTTCTASTSKTLQKFFTVYYTPLGHGLTLTGGLPALSTRFFKITLTFETFSKPTTANKFQGKTAKFSLAWYVNQTGP